MHQNVLDQEIIESPSQKGFHWALENKGKIFCFTKPKNLEALDEKIYGRITGFAEDFSGGFFFIKTREEPEGKVIMMPTIATVSEIEDQELLALLERKIPKDKKNQFEYYIGGPEHNIHYYGKPDMTPIGRTETR